MLYIAISVTMFALIGGIWLLSKVKTDAMGAFAKWMAYLIIIVSLGMLICELWQASSRMMRCEGSEKCGHQGMRGHHKMGGMMYCPPEMCGGKECYMPAHCMMGGGGCAMMGGGKMHGAMKCCDEEMGKGEAGCHDMEDQEKGGMKKDTASKI